MDEKARRGGVFWPLFLIGLGLIFLLNNLGVLSWEIWPTLLRIWPAFLIAAGIDLLIGRRSAWGALVALVLIVAVFALVVWLAWEPTKGEPVTSEKIAQPLPLANSARVTLRRGAGEVRLRSLSDSNNLLEGTLSLHRGERARYDQEVSEQVAAFSLQGQGNYPVTYSGGNRPWDLKLNPKVEYLDLEMQMGAGEGELDLRELEVRRLGLNLAVGRSVIKLPERGHCNARVSMAIGEVVVEIPKESEARITLKTGLVGRDISSRFREVSRGVYETAGYGSTQQQIDLEVALAIGSVRVQ